MTSSPREPDARASLSPLGRQLVRDIAKDFVRAYKEGRADHYPAWCVEAYAEGVWNRSKSS
ncbi:hypothetical protein NX801_16320 [Streptomyces sp. LP05-1]|uniref:Uncharacterized protein n=1 Tax=Streptomyces pyxinae TaxID=2970734 RepID=A0ABT2CIF1_9ACTN|nr:hypothetical protein [Streptomyces sp. LP05-1]MCS0637199.1 hypothetical protein [Streptomyces sp. LP05-1]